MQYRVNPKNGEKLSALGYGCMRYTRRGGAIDQEKANREMALALEQGVNYFDTAYIYPGCEAALGSFIREYDCRGRIRIATKLPHYRVKRAEDFDAFFGEELARLGTDYIDYYLMHMLNDAASWQRLCEMGIREWIGAKKASGQIRNIGFSFHGGTAQFMALMDAWDWDFCQIQFNYMDEHSQAGIAGLRYAHEKGLAVIIMEPLRGGRLVNRLPKEARREFEKMQPARTPADWGLRWVWNHPEVTVVLSGMNDPAQVEENCRVAADALPGSLTAEELALYDRVLRAVRTGIKVGCTGCGYCRPCPKGVDIPTCFSAYNASYAENLFAGMKDYMMCTTIRKVRSNAGLCVKCGRCEKNCPQHIPIRKELDRVKQRLENPVYKIAAKLLPAIMRY